MGITEGTHPLTRPTFRNCGRIAIHPTGIRDFSRALRDDLNQQNTITGKFLVGSAMGADLAKYFFYGVTMGAGIYQVAESLIDKI